MNGTSPASLIQGMSFNSAGCEGWEEFVVSIDMIVEAVYEDDLCYWWSVGLENVKWECRESGIGS